MALRGLEQDRHWPSSKACADATVDASRAFCKGYFDMKAEAARASEARRWRNASPNSEAKRDGLEEQGAGREADNQAAVLARVLGVPAAEVERGLTLFLAVLVEIGAALWAVFRDGACAVRKRPCAGAGGP